MNSTSKHFRDLVQQISSAGRTEETVCLVGEIGTGKRQAAVTIHRASNHRPGRFITINCMGLSDEEFAIDLFGRMSDDGELVRKGAANLADAGTLYLHEVCELSKRAQAMLVRFLETDSYRPIGGLSTLNANVRLLVSSSLSMEAAVESAVLRNDLYHLLTPIVIHLPRLNDRLEDIPFLFRSVLGEIAHQYDRIIDEPAFELLRNHSFNGNLLELRNIATRIVSKYPDGPISAEMMQTALRGTNYSNHSAHSFRSAPEVVQNAYQQLDHEVRRLSHPQDLKLRDGDATEQQQQQQQQNDSDANAGYSPLNSAKRLSELEINDIDAAEAGQKATAAPRPAAPRPAAPKPAAPLMTLKEQEAAYLSQLLEQFDNDKSKVAEVAGLTLRTLYRRLKELDIQY